MRVTKKKLKEEYGDPSAGPGTPRSANTNTPKKAGKAVGRNGGLSSAAGTPSGGGKKRGRKPKGYEGGGGGEDDADDVEEEEGSPLKKGKMGGFVEVKREKDLAEEDDEESFLQ